MENNKNLESAFADTKNLEMTPEVEQELNKIYEEKEGIDMLNSNKIKRGTEITNGKEATIYTLEFLKDYLRLYLLYLLDWVEWFENENSYVKEYTIDELYEWGEENKTPFLLETKLENGLCKNIINEIIVKIDNAKEIINEGKSYTWYKCAIEDIKNSKEKIDVLMEYYKSFSILGLSICRLNFYENIVCTPLYLGHKIIEKIIEKLEKVNEETLKMKIENE